MSVSLSLSRRFRCAYRKLGICQVVTASTTAPVSLAWWIAQRSAALDDSKPSTPTTGFADQSPDGTTATGPWA